MSYAPIRIEWAERFRRKNGISPGPQIADDNGVVWWYFVVYCDYRSQGFKNHIFRWRPGIKAEHVALQSPTDARGDIAVHPIGAAVFSWDNASADYPDLWVQNLDGFVPAELAGVAELRARVEALEQRLAEIGTAPTGVADAVKWVEAVRAIP